MIILYWRENAPTLEGKRPPTRAPTKIVDLAPVVTVYRVRKLFRTVCPLVHCCTELRVPAIYVLPIESGLSVWWSVEYAT